MPARKGTAGRAVSDANLKPNAHRSHGCYSIERLLPLRAEHEQALAADYPSLDGRRRALLADRLARTQLAADWAAEHGLVRNSRGDVFPIVDRLERWASRAEDMLAVAEQLEREQATNPSSTLAAILGEYDVADGDGEPS